MIFNIKNFGILQETLPQDLFLKLKEECLSISEETHERMTSGLTTNGVPLHYNVKHNKDKLVEYVDTLVYQYIDIFEMAIQSKLESDQGYTKDIFKDVKRLLVHGSPWINIQKIGEYIPNHDHNGLIAYTIWVNIPETTIFQYSYNAITGEQFRENINVTKAMEGNIIMFPSKLIHCVYPFFNSRENRISVSGNINLG